MNILHNLTEISIEISVIYCIYNSLIFFSTKYIDNNIKIC